MDKIAFVTRNMMGGGAERVLSQLISYFCGHGVECILILVDAAPVFYNISDDVKIYTVGEQSASKIKDKFLRYKKIRNIIKSENPTAVLSMPEEIGIYVILSLLGTNIPVYVSERNNPWVMPDKKITRALRKIAYPFAKGIIFQTEMAKSFFSKKIQQKGIVLNNPVEAGRIPKKFEGTRKKTIVAAGRLFPQKNFKMLINAFDIFAKNNPDFTLLIYGEGPLKNEIENLICEKHLENKVFLKGKSYSLLEDINEAAMFVLSSDYEGMPNVLLEAMCMGMPVISTDCPSGGPASLIDNYENGILVPVNDPKSLAKAMEDMSDIEFSDKCAVNAYKLRNVLTDVGLFEKWKEFLLG